MRNLPDIGIGFGRQSPERSILDPLESPEAATALLVDPTGPNMRRVLATAETASAEGDAELAGRYLATIEGALRDLDVPPEEPIEGLVAVARMQLQTVGRISLPEPGPDEGR